MSFGKELKKILENKKMSVAELSRKTNIPANTLYAIINRDSKNINFSTIYKISKALDLGTDEEALLDMMINPEAWSNYITDGKPSKNSNDLLKLKKELAGEDKIVFHYRQLNAAGQNKAVEQVEMLTKIPEYQKATPQNSVHLPNAAHERKGANFTPEDRQADEDMINEDESTQ